MDTFIRDASSQDDGDPHSARRSPGQYFSAAADLLPSLDEDIDTDGGESDPLDSEELLETSSEPQRSEVEPKASMRSPARLLAVAALAAAVAVIGILAGVVLFSGGDTKSVVVRTVTTQQPPVIASVEKPTVLPHLNDAPTPIKREQDDHGERSRAGSVRKRPDRSGSKTKSSNERRSESQEFGMLHSGASTDAPSTVVRPAPSDNSRNREFAPFAQELEP